MLQLYIDYLSVLTASSVALVLDIAIKIIPVLAFLFYSSSFRA